MGIIVPGNGGIWYYGGHTKGGSGRYRFSAPTPDLPDNRFPGKPYHGKWRGWCDGCQRVRFKKQMEPTRNFVKYCYECLQKRRENCECTRCAHSRYVLRYRTRRVRKKGYSFWETKPYVCAACSRKRRANPDEDGVLYCLECAREKIICRRCGNRMD